MKIAITTVFKSENCGSFLQAWALERQLVSMGHEVVFCDYELPKKIISNRKAEILKCCLRFRFKRAYSIVRKSLDFKRLTKRIKAAVNMGDKADFYIFGSDTLWNFKDKYFEENAGFFTGANINKPCYAYAISVDSSPKESLLKNETAVLGIKKMKKIAVRDSYTKEVLSDIYPCENTVRTVDPTILCDKEIYKSCFSARLPYTQKSLVVYYFGDISKEKWALIRKTAKERGLVIVGIGFYDKKFDYSIVSSPENFISAFANAEYIFTNTFHGCVFSTIFNKRFVTDAVNKKKVQEFLKQFSLQDRCATESEDLEKILCTDINYENINVKIEEERAASIDYLNSIICEESIDE